MAAERLDMGKLRQILRLRYFAGIESSRTIAKSLRCGKTTVNEYLAKAREAGITRWEELDPLDHNELRKRLGLELTFETHKQPSKPLPDWMTIHEELRNRDVTLALLWTEYRDEHPDGYQYTQFAEYYRRWRGKLALVMRQTHPPGKKGFIDFCDGIPITDRNTGEKTPTQLFVGAMGASSYTFARATHSQKLPEWVDVNKKFLEFLGGVPAILVPDNLKSGVKSPCRYEPEINATYEEMAEHYGTAIIPARVRHPRDKAIAENAVLQAQRWIIAVLRKRTFYNLAEINHAIETECLPKLNNKPMRGYGKSRRELFLTIDKPALKPLPQTPYEYAEWKKVRLGLDYHIRYDDHFYSAPYQLYREELMARATIRTLEIFFKGKRVASHLRSSVKFGKTTLKEHMPSHHRAYAEWTPERIMNWASTVGQSVAKVVDKMLEERAHPEQAYQAAIGLIKLADIYGKDRVEKAATKALMIASPRFKTIKTMLQNKMEEVDLNTPTVEPDGQLLLIAQENVRGGGYYH